MRDTSAYGWTRAQLHVRAHKRTHALTHTRTSAHTHKRTHAQAHKRTHAQPHTCTTAQPHCNTAKQGERHPHALARRVRVRAHSSLKSQFKPARCHTLQLSQYVTVGLCTALSNVLTPLVVQLILAPWLCCSLSRSLGQHRSFGSFSHLARPLQSPALPLCRTPKLRACVIQARMHTRTRARVPARMGSVLRVGGSVPAPGRPLSRERRLRRRRPTIAGSRAHTPLNASARTSAARYSSRARVATP
eukprot:2817617-Pleurochrysis_carterae.AAC.1